MTVDTGGLDYTLEAKDKFSGTFAKFKKDLASARKELNAFKADLATLKKSSDSATTAQNRQSESARRLSSETEKARDSLRKLTATQRALNAASRDLNKSQAALSREVEKTGKAVDKAEKANKTGTTGGVSTAEQKKVNELGKRFNTILGETDSKGNRLSFTFRRLFGILAAFTIVREIFNGIVRAIGTIITTSARLESATLGIATVLSAVAIIFNANGEIVKGSEAIAIAQQEAARQTRLLKRDALLTSATFEELAEAYQVALGPGLQAGLNPDEIRRFTRQISLAAQAIGLEQNKLAEEVRSILGGTIRIQQTRIAAVLGIDNEDINKAKEAGRLVEFLNEKFQEFEASGFLAANTFQGLLARVTDGLRLLLAEGGILFFTELKDTLRDVLSTVVQVNAATGDVTLNPQLLVAVHALSIGLSDALDTVRSFAREAGFDSAVNAAFLLGQTISQITTFIKAFALGVSDALKIVTSIADIFLTISGISEGLFDTDAGPLQEIFRILGAILTITISIQTIAFVFGPLLRGLGVLMFVLQNALVLIRAALTSIRTLALAIRAIAIGTNIPLLLAVGIIGTILSLTGILSSTIEFISDKVADISGPLIDKLDDKLKALTSETQEDVDTLITTSVRGLQEVQDALSKVNSDLQSLRASNIARLSAILEDTEFGDFDPTGNIASILANFRTLSEDSRVAIDRLNSGIKDSKKELVELGAQYVGLEQQLQDLPSFQAYTVEQFNADEERFNQLNQQLQDARKNSERAESRLRTLNDALAANRRDPIGESIVASQIDTQQQKLAAAQQKEKEAKEELEELDTSLLLLGRQRRDVLGQQFGLTQNIKALESQISEAEKARLNLLNEFIDKQIQSVRIKIAELNAIGREQNLRRAIDVQFAESLTTAKILGDTEKEKLITLQKDLAIRELEANIERQSIQNNITRLQQLRDEVAERAKNLELSLEDKDLTKEQLADNQRRLQDAVILRQAINTQIDLQLEKLKQVNELTEQDVLSLEQQLKDQAIRAGGSIREQINLALKDIEKTLPNRFQLIFQTLDKLVKDFGNLVAGVIVDAFDPTKDVDLKERFARFLQGIAQQVISTLVQIATVKLLLGLSGLFPVGAAQGGVVQSFADGGGVRRGRRSRRRTRAVSFDSGGPVSGANALPVAPPGFPATDKVPAMLTEGEFVNPVDSVLTYGADFFENLRRRMIDPMAARALMPTGGRSVRRVRAAKRPIAMQEGGLAGAPIRTTRNADTGSTSSVTTTPVLVADEELMDRLVRGGSSTLLQFLDDNGFKRSN